MFSLNEDTFKGGEVKSHDFLTYSWSNYYGDFFSHIPGVTTMGTSPLISLGQLLWGLLICVG